MNTPVERVAIARILGWTGLLATLAVTPWATVDPINVPKLVVIAAGGFAVLGGLIVRRTTLFNREHRTLLLISGVFALDLLLVLLFAGNNFYQEFFGTNGRSTGFLAYVALLLLLVGSAAIASKETLGRVSNFLLAAGGASIIYGLLQTFGADPIAWVNQYNPVIGFLGNPNFQSSFVGFVGVMAFALTLNQNAKALVRALYGFFVLMAVFVIVKTDSQQGLLVLAGGIAVVLMIWIYSSKFKVVTVPALIISAIGAVFVALGSLNSGPLASLLYKASVTYRGDYWRAGWKMTLEHPFFGVGLDSFGDWYRRARTLEATLRRGPDVTSNAAHNVLLDFSSNGGFPLVIIYVALMTLVGISAIKLLKRSKAFNPVLAGLIAVWIAYLAQSIISLNQLGLAVWGWIISGLIIGYEINTRERADAVDPKAPATKGRQAKAKGSQGVSATTLLSIVAGVTVGLVIALPPFIASANFRTALQSGNAETVQNAAAIWPKDASRYGQVALVLSGNKLDVQALSIAQEGAKLFPSEFGLWKVIVGLTNATPAQITEAKEQMKRLDPFNPDLK